MDDYAGLRLCVARLVTDCQPVLLLTVVLSDIYRIINTWSRLGG